MIPKSFYHLLGNTLAVSVMNFTVWFAITFYVYLQTQSVFATGMISGIYLVTTALTGIWFGSLVDHHKKKQVMMGAIAFSMVMYALSFIVYQTAPEGAFTNPANSILWVLVTLLILGVMAGNINGIAMPTVVSILVPADKRDRANGLVGTASGISFLVTSVISGVLVAANGMFYVLLLALAVMALALVHLLLITVPEKGIAHLANQEGGKKIDLKGTIKIVRGIPGLPALICFTTFNNFLGGVFMSLMDAYGLSMVSVQAWGFLWGVLSTGFILGGLMIAKTGLGKNPLRIMMLVNVILWAVTILFPLHASVILLAGGMYTYMILMPYVEASEQTILQKVVPLERQGRVFGFAQSVEQAASPLTAFMIGPITQFFFIPLMTDGKGAQAIGSWFGTGPARGIALVFVITAVIGLIVTLLAWGSKYYRDLSAYYLNAKESARPKVGVEDPIKQGYVE